MSDKETGQYVITQITSDKRFTADDYAKLPYRAPYQLIEGELVFMASPYFNHQEISFNLVLKIGNYVQQNNLGKVAYSPMDVHLDEKNIYQPDILFVSIKRSSIIKKFIFGAPDFVLEIISKSTESKDRNEKMRNYGKFGVDEYWIVNLKKENIEVYHNQAGIMIHQKTAEKGDSITSKAIEGFTLNVGDVFS
ncbi:MAG: Uma2 family endonuclease [Leptospiraceae bacterium]|nr:Uma2 family endonuclease [Leptospiraceae bacterium]MCP5502914.1 Uma2 family endonuclease [Leptospiraceae bacterium]